MSKVFDLPGWESGPFRAIGGVTAPPPPPPVGGGGGGGLSAYRKLFGVFSLPQALWGVGPALDTCFSDSNGSNYVGVGGYISALRAAGACAIIKVTGGSSKTVENGSGQFRNPDGSAKYPSLSYPDGNPVVDGASGTFSPAILISNFNIWAAAVEAVTGGLAEMRAAFRDGIIRAILFADDYSAPRARPEDNGYTEAPKFELLEKSCHGIKLRTGWGWTTVVGRVRSSHHRSLAAAAAITDPAYAAYTNDGSRINGVRQYRYMDGSWMQHRATHDGDPATYFEAEYRDGLACSLGGVTGANALRRGKGPPSTKFPNSDGWATVLDPCAPTSPQQYTLSPAEFRKVGLAAIRHRGLAGPKFWSYTGGSGCGNAWYDHAQIQAVWTNDLEPELVGLKDASINIRGDLVVA